MAAWNRALHVASVIVLIIRHDGGNAGPLIVCSTARPRFLDRVHNLAPLWAKTVFCEKQSFRRLMFAKATISKVG